jgi:hypothetical protein
LAEERTIRPITARVSSGPDWDSQLGRFKEVAFVDAFRNARSTISITRRGDEMRILEITS